MEDNQKSIFEEILNRFQEDNKMRLDDAYYQGLFLSLERATAAMIEVGLDRKRIAELLIKYWDLRPSEAKNLIETNPARLSD